MNRSDRDFGNFEATDAASEDSAASDPQVSLSVVIPARDEEFELPRTLASVAAAMDACDAQLASSEVIVVDDGSTDRTAAIARDAGATVVAVELHNIGQVRNAGAAAATGEAIVFLDADTRLPPETLRAALEQIAGGAIGGGAGCRWDQPPPLAARISSTLFLFGWQTVAKWAAGCFIYCRRDAFEAVGGFDPQWLAAEERWLSRALKQEGKRRGRPWVMLRESVVSSARKLRMFGTLDLVRVAAPVLLLPGGLFGSGSRLKSARGLEFFYDAPRETADATPATPPANETSRRPADGSGG